LPTQLAEDGFLNMNTMPSALRRFTLRFTQTLPALLAAALLLGTPSLPAQTIATTTNDVVTMRQMLATVTAWEAQGKKAFDAPVLAELDTLWRKGYDPLLRIRAREIIPALEKAALARPHLLAVAEAVKAARGTVRFEGGGPQWLRDMAGDEAMHLFDRLTAIDLNDKGNPHDPTYKRNTTLSDAWLTNLVNLPDLAYLDLSNSNIAGPGLKHVGALKSLERLNLTLTLITDPWLEQLGGLTNLRVISLASAKSSGAGYKFLGNLKRLESANFHTAPVDDAGIAGISKVPSHERLEIVHTHFTDAGAQPLAKLVNLERLQLGSRKATGAAVKPLTGLKKLRELDLHDGQASVEGVRHASEIQSLRVLRVYGPIKDEGAQHLARLKNLEVLLVPGTQITDASLEVFASLSRLKRLEISGNKITDAAIAKLKATLPGLEVVK
jgi:Leucine-rich repeat (LRR) protein